MVPFKDRRRGRDRRSGKDRRKPGDQSAPTPQLQAKEELGEVAGTGVSLRKDLSEVWNSKGKELLRQNQYDEARKAFRMAVQIKPQLAEAWYNLASVDSYKGEKEDALSELRKAIEIELGFKEKAKVNRYFKKLQENEVFKKLLE